MGLRTGAPAAQGRTGPRPLRRSLLAWPPSSWVDDDDRLRLSANPPPRRSERGKKESATARRSRRCRRSAAPCWQSSPPPRPIDALTAREPSVERSNESAKVVLVLAHGPLFAQARSPSASQGPCGNCPYLCVNRQCVNADIAQPMDFSVCVPWAADYLCPDKETSKVFVV